INWLLQGTCDDLDKTVRRFIWKGSGDVGMHLVSWNKITQPRRFGGLSVRVSRLQNISLLGKLVWEILNSPDKLWVKLLEERYLKEHFIFNTSVSGGSVIWNSIAKTIHRLRDGFNIKIGEGNSNFWFYPWVFKEMLGSMVSFVAIQNTATKIKDVWYDRNWRACLPLFRTLPVMRSPPFNLALLMAFQMFEFGIMLVLGLICSVDVKPLGFPREYYLVAFAKPSPASAKTQSQQLVAWYSPPEGYVCLNVDGSLLGSPQSAGFGGLIRNNVRSFLGGFYGVASQTSILYAEIIALLHGLLCWEKGNACVDLLAKMEANSIAPLVKLVVPLAEMSSHLLVDAWGVAFVRE
ncbi:ribonuclease H, partial [Trifolium pratense]